MSGDVFSCHNWVCVCVCVCVCARAGRVTTGIYWVEARDAVERCTMHRTVPITKNDLAQNVNSAEVEETCFNNKS